MKSEPKSTRRSHQQPSNAAGEDLPFILAIAAFNTVSLVGVASGVSPEDAFIKGLLALLIIGAFAYLGVAIASPAPMASLSQARPLATEPAGIAVEEELIVEPEPMDIQAPAESREEALVGSGQ